MIDVLTGLVLDFEVVSKYCHACVLNKKRPMTDADRAKWKEEHAQHCLINHEGSSKAMEMEAAGKLWKRSVSRNMLHKDIVLTVILLL